MKICTVIFDEKDVLSEIKVLYSEDFFLKNELDMREHILYQMCSKFNKEYKELSKEDFNE
jgi:hypothetical protein